MMPLTETQRKVYEFIKSSALTPTRAEICEHFGWTSANAAQCCLRAIERKGWIELLGGKRARGIILK